MLSQRQTEIVNGSLLGDGTIWTNFVDPLCKFQITQSKLDNLGNDKQTYMLWFVSEFMNLGCSIRNKIIEPQKGICAGGKYYQYVFNTKCNTFWTMLEKQWYVPRTHNFWRRRKIVPTNLKLTPLTLCIWHMDDGSNESQEANITLNTQGFTSIEVDFLIERLKQDLGLKTTKKKAKKENQFRIYVGRKSYFDFIDIIKPHVQWNCFKYKIDDTTYNKIAQIGENHSQAKINEKEVKQIFDLKEQGFKHKEIANQFNICQSTVTQILNGKRWKHLNKCINPRIVKRATTDQKQEIEFLLKQGMSQKEISLKLGLNQSTISRIGARCLE